MNHPETGGAPRAASIPAGQSPSDAQELENIRGRLVEILPKGPQDLESAAELADIAAQCMKLLQHKNPVWLLEGEFESDANPWRKGLFVRDNIDCIEWHWDDDKVLEDVSAPVYRFARDLRLIFDELEAKKEDYAAAIDGEVA
jgi:hypothetical protein